MSQSHLFMVWKYMEDFTHVKVESASRSYCYHEDSALMKTLIYGFFVMYICVKQCWENLHRFRFYKTPIAI